MSSTWGGGYCYTPLSAILMSCCSLHVVLSSPVGLWIQSKSEGFMTHRVPCTAEIIASHVGFFSMFLREGRRAGQRRQRQGQSTVIVGGLLGVGRRGNLFFSSSLKLYATRSRQQPQSGGRIIVRSHPSDILNRYREQTPSLSSAVASREL